MTAVVSLTKSALDFFAQLDAAPGFPRALLLLILHVFIPERFDCSSIELDSMIADGIVGSTT